MENNASALGLSLLYPKRSDKTDATEPVDGETFADLGIERILEPMIINKKRKSVITGPAALLCQKKEVIEYRLDVLEDLLRNPKLLSSMEEILPNISQLQYYVMHPGSTEATPLQETVWRLRELENYIICMETFHEAFSGSTGKQKSRGLQQLKSAIETAREDPAYQQLQAELPDLLTYINRIKSITLGVNLNEGLIPIEAVVLGVNPEPFQETGFMKHVSTSHSGTAIGRLHSVKGTEYYSNPTLVPLFKDLSDALGKGIKPLQKALKQYGRLNGMMFVTLMDEFMFYLGASRLTAHMREMGLPMVRPVIHDGKRRTIKLGDFYNIDLALQLSKKQTGQQDTGKSGSGSGLSGEIIQNDFSGSEERRLFILTGPNSGGKTTFLQSVGLIQYLGQLGLFVPAGHAEISICNNIYTHYPNLESADKGAGRLGEEAERLRFLFRKAKPNSLVLLNETLSSTSAGEAVYLAQDILKVLNQLGRIVIFVTHLHQLASDREELTSGGTAQSSVISLVAQIRKEDEGYIPSYKVIESTPEGKSYAREIARMHGINKEQLLEYINRESD